MATIYRELERKSKSLPQGGGIFQEAVTKTAADTVVLLLPIQAVEGISVMTSGVAGAVVEATNYDHETVEAGGGAWAMWDGTSQFSNGITALRLSGTTGSIVSVSARTHKA